MSAVAPKAKRPDRPRRKRRLTREYVVVDVAPKDPEAGELALAEWLAWLMEAPPR